MSQQIYGKTRRNRPNELDMVAWILENIRTCSGTYFVEHKWSGSFSRMERLLVQRHPLAGSTAANNDLKKIESTKVNLKKFSSKTNFFVESRSITISRVLLVISDRPTDRPTNGPTDQRTDRPTDQRTEQQRSLQSRVQGAKM